MEKTIEQKEKELKIKRNTVIHCTTKKLAIKVLDIVDYLGYTWCDRNSYKDDNKWALHKNKMCYNIITGSYAILDFYVSECYNIITAEEFIALHTNKNNIIMKSIYQVKKSDLICKIKDFPIEVVQKMVECQVEQGNKADITVFQRHHSISKSYGGFNWDESREGSDFWIDVIFNRKFDVFFERYSKINKNVYYRGDEKRGDEIIKALTKLGGTICNYRGINTDLFYFITPKTNKITCCIKNSDTFELLQELYTEAHLPEIKKETINIGGREFEVSDELKKAMENLKEV